MIQEFSLDLKAARRNSGLRQSDVAHLMGASKSKITYLENGRQRPTVKDICMLSMIYGRSFETLFAGIFNEVKAELISNLFGLPEPNARYKRRMNRENTLRNLEARLSSHNQERHDA